MSLPKLVRGICKSLQVMADQEGRRETIQETDCPLLPFRNFYESLDLMALAAVARILFLDALMWVSC